jgi:hypothetical protein
MTIVSDEVVAEIIDAMSEGAERQDHVASVVGTFIQTQPMIGHYVQAHAKDLGLEGVVLTLLHVAIIAACIERARGRDLRKLTSKQLDLVTKEKRTLDDEPALASYLESNLDPKDPTLGGKKFALAESLLHTAARALLLA